MKSAKQLCIIACSAIATIGLAVSSCSDDGARPQEECNADKPCPEGFVCSENLNCVEDNTTNPDPGTPEDPAMPEDPNFTEEQAACPEQPEEAAAAEESYYSNDQNTDISSAFRNQNHQAAPARTGARKLKLKPPQK